MAAHTRSKARQQHCLESSNHHTHNHDHHHRQVQTPAGHHSCQATPGASKHSTAHNTQHTPHGGSHTLQCWAEEELPREHRPADAQSTRPWLIQRDKLYTGMVQLPMRLKPQRTREALHAVLTCTSPMQRWGPCTGVHANTQTLDTNHHTAAAAAGTIAHPRWNPRCTTPGSSVGSAVECKPCVPRVWPA